MDGQIEDVLKQQLNQTGSLARRIAAGETDGPSELSEDVMAEGMKRLERE